jgi:hypothetical protein
MLLPAELKREQAYALGRRWKLPELPLSISLDPISLITLFLDDAEKDLMYRSGDMTWLCCFGLFANPTTAWIEYGTLPPGYGVRYYNPLRGLTSTIEVAHVNRFVTKLAGGLENAGLIVKLLPRRASTVSSPEWVIVRPFILVAIVVVVAMSSDYIAMTALISILVGQTIVVAVTIRDRTKFVNSCTSEPMDSNVIFLANNVTVIVKSPAPMFIKACSSKEYKKMERPTVFQVFATLMFMIGILLIGIAGINAKVAYLVGHVVQAVLIALLNKRPLKSRTLNSVWWEINKPLSGRSIKRRRDAYVWACENTTGDVEWLKAFNLADPDTLEFIQAHLGASNGFPPFQNVSNQRFQAALILGKGCQHLLTITATFGRSDKGSQLKTERGVVEAKIINYG